MIYAQSAVGGNVEIVAADNYRAIPIICHGDGILKAGTPITSGGTAALDGSGAIGILLYDVDASDNPVGAVVVFGVIDYEKAKKNAGITATAATLKSAIPALTFRTNIAASTVGAEPLVGTALIGEAIVA